MYELGDRGNIGQTHQGVCRRLDEHRARLVGHRVGDLLWVTGVDIAERQANVVQDPVEQGDGPAVDVLAADDMITGAEEFHDRVERGEATGKGEAVPSVFERGNVSLERFAGR